MPMTKNPENLTYRSVRELAAEAKKGVPPQVNSCRTHYQTAQKLYAKAMQAKNAGDLETAFLLFYRFGNFALLLKKATDFSDKKYPDLTKAAQAISEAEIIGDRLRCIYDDRKTENKQHDASVLNGVVGLTLNDTQQVTSPSSANPQDQGRTAKQVYELLNNHRCLVIDVRDERSFADSHINIENICNVPARCLRPSMIPADLDRLMLSPKTMALLRRRYDFDYVVILDNETRGAFQASVPDQHPVRVLYDLLCRRNGDRTLKNAPVMLNGGYKLWLASYPMKTTNCNPNDASLFTSGEQQSQQQQQQQQMFMSDVQLPTSLAANIYPTLEERDSSLPTAPPASTAHHPAPLLDRALKPLPYRTGGPSGLGEPTSSLSTSPVPSAPGLELPYGKSSLPRSHSLTDVLTADASSGHGGYVPNGGIKPVFDRASKPAGSSLNHSLPGSGLSGVRSSVAPSTHAEKTAGLKNLGNTCYMNASLQCLAHTTAFALYFLQGDFRAHLNRDVQCNKGAGGGGGGSGGDTGRSKSRLPEILELLIGDMYDGGKNNNALTMFKAVMDELFPSYAANQQQDAHEFLLNLLNTLHESLNRAPDSNVRDVSEAPNISERNVEIALNKFFAAHQDRHHSVVSDIFEGILMSQVECVTCSKSSFRFEVFSVLSLPIPQPSADRGGVVTLDDCFREFFQVERITEEIWECPHCKVKRKAEKHLRIARLPKTLVLQFIRFKHDKGPYGSEKIGQFVRFDETIRLDPYLDSRTQPQARSYSLYGFVNHTGNLTAGHYTAFCRSRVGSDARWFKYDDSVVSPAQPGDAEKQATYMLFYTSQQYDSLS